MDIEPIPDDVESVQFPEEELRQHIQRCIRSCAVTVATYMAEEDSDLRHATRFQERFSGYAGQMLGELSVEPPVKNRRGRLAMRGAPMDDYIGGIGAGVPGGFLGEVMELLRGQIAEAKRTNDRLSGKKEREEAQLLLPVGHHKNWKKEQWETMVTACKTRKGLAELTGLSGKTVKKSLNAHGIIPPWSRAKPLVIEMELASKVPEVEEQPELPLPLPRISLAAEYRLEQST